MVFFTVLHHGCTMTCEIIIMNRGAAVLAADSTVTVTRWVDNREVKRYFKSVNKVFQISKHRPVGMMVYGSGDLQAVPWEVVAKAFRGHLADRGFRTLPEYADCIREFIQTADNIFPRAYREEVFKADIRKAALRFFFEVIEPDQNFQNGATDADKITASAALLSDSLTRVDAIAFLPGFLQADLDDAITQFYDELKMTLDGYNIPIDTEKLAEFAIKGIFKAQLYMGESGVVITGFGDDEFFPRSVEFTIYGNILGKVAYKILGTGDIDYANASYLKGFATTQMINTFLLGVSPEAFQDADLGCKESLANIATALGQANHPDLNDLIETESGLFRQKLMNRSGQKNYEPLKSIVAVLPVDEMAHLAETLVSLESLKEKVTRPTESVGGPVDVAVITRGEGLIWIKRKHYFDPALNPRYFQRTGL